MLNFPGVICTTICKVFLGLDLAEIQVSFYTEPKPLQNFLFLMGYEFVGKKALGELAEKHVQCCSHANGLGFQGENPPIVNISREICVCERWAFPFQGERGLLFYKAKGLSWYECLLVCLYMFKI